MSQIPDRESSAAVAIGSSVSNRGLRLFAGGKGDGATPLGSLTLADGALYGMTSVGGASNKGVVFALSNIPSEPPMSLTIIQANDQAIVSWLASGWTLQTNDGLAASTWSNYSGPIIGNAVTKSLTKENLFFRLLCP